MSLLILDLGGVLYDIDFERTRRAMLDLPGYNGAPIEFGVESQSDVFIAYDRGDISTSEFRGALRGLYGFTCSNDELDRAWCAILERGLFADATERVRGFERHYNVSRTVILSNISELHYLDSAERCKPVFDLVDESYFSYLIRLRKPDPQAFLYVCAQQGYSPSETTLVDDSRSNCDAAQALGISVCWWQSV